MVEKFIGFLRIDQLRIRLKELDQPPLEEVCRLTDTFFLARRDENLVLKNLPYEENRYRETQNHQEKPKKEKKDAQNSVVGTSPS